MTRFTHQPILGGKRLRQKFFGLAFGVFFLIGFISLSEAADSILVGAINPPPPGTSYGYAVNDVTWVAIQFGLTKTVQINSVGAVLNSANPSVVLQGVIVDSLNFNHITYATFSITNPQSGTEMTVAALPLPVTLPPGNYFLVLQGISGTAWWTGSDGSFSLSAGALGGNMFSSSGLWDYEPGMGQAFYKSDWPVAMFELNGKLVADSDGDGVLDVADQCPNSILTRTVIIGQRNSGVSNQLFSTGCTTSDLIAQAASSAKTHGQFMSAVDDITNELMKIGAISESEKDAIQSCAAKTKIP